MKKFNRGRLFANKVRYPDGVGICLWWPMDEDTDTGLCWDISGEDLDDLVNLLLDVREAEADVYEQS